MHLCEAPDPILTMQEMKLLHRELQAGKALLYMLHQQYFKVDGLMSVMPELKPKVPQSSGKVTPEKGCNCSLHQLACPSELTCSAQLPVTPTDTPLVSVSSGTPELLYFYISNGIHFPEQPLIH